MTSNDDEILKLYKVFANKDKYLINEAIGKDKFKFFVATCCYKNFSLPLDILKHKISSFLITSDPKQIINSKNKENKNILQIAIEENDPFVVHELLKKYNNELPQISKGNPMFYFAVKSNKTGTEVIKVILDFFSKTKQDYLLNERNSLGQTALFPAVYKLNTEKVKLLLEYGFDPEAKTEVGDTPIEVCLNTYRDGNKLKIKNDKYNSFESIKKLLNDYKIKK